MKTDEKRVALFATCLVDQVMPEVGVAAVRLLRRAGFQVDFPQIEPVISTSVQKIIPTSAAL